MITCTVIAALVIITVLGMGWAAWYADRPEHGHRRPTLAKRVIRRVTARKPTTGWGALLRRPLAAADIRTIAWVRALSRPMEAARVQGAVLAWLIDHAHAAHEDLMPLPGRLPGPVDAGPAEYALFSDDTSWRQFTALKEVS